MRIAGVNVGKVKSKELDRKGARTIVEVEIDEAYAPIPRDSRAILRQKTLLGETYLELAPGDPRRGLLDDGERLANAQVEPTVELDEIFTAFDPHTRKAFQDWVKELVGRDRGRPQPGPQRRVRQLRGLRRRRRDAAGTMLDEQDLAVKRLVRNTGEVFGAINERRGALRELIVNSKRTLRGHRLARRGAGRDVRVFPTFLDESKATLARLERFSADTRPLVNDLKAPADDLGPTVRDLGDLAPDLERLFRDLDPLDHARATRRAGARAHARGGRAARRGRCTRSSPSSTRSWRYFNYHQSTIAGFITNGASDLSADYGTGQHGQTQIGLIDGRSLEGFPYGEAPPDFVRGNAYLAPNALNRALQLGTIESFDCPGGVRRDPNDATEVGEASGDKRAPCLIAPKSPYDGRLFPVPEQGEAPLRQPPRGVPGQPAGERPESRRLTRAGVPCAGAEAKPAPKWVLQRNASSLRHVHAPGRTFESPQKKR